MGKLEDKVVIMDNAGDMHRGTLSTVSKARLRAVMLDMLKQSLEEADTLEELGQVYIQKVGEL